MRVTPHHTAILKVASTLLCLVIVATRPIQTHAQDEQSEMWSPWTWTPSEIRSTGAVRFSEVLRMMPAVETWSPDRYTLRFLGTGLPGLHPEGPAVELDGVTLPSFFLDRVLTEGLPVSPGELTSLAWLPGQHVSPGGRMTEGRLILTTPMQAGWHASGAVALINETGDPGPAKHSDARLNNVDRSGPATWLRAGWGNRRWMVQAGLQTDLHHLTDDRISGRVRRTYAEPAQSVITQFSPFLRIRHAGTRWTGHLMTGQSRRKDFIFHEAAGWEWPARLNRSWMAGRLTGSWERVRFTLETDASRIELSDRPAFIDLPPGISLQEASMAASLVARFAGLNWEIGIGARSSDISQSGRTLTRMMPSGRLKISRSTETWQSYGSLDVLDVPADDWRDATLGYLAAWGLSHRGESGGLDLEARYSTGWFPQSGQLTEWAVAGLDLGEWMTLSPLTTSATMPRSLGFGLTGHRSLNANWTGWLEGRVRWMDGQLMPDRIFEQPFGVGPLLPSWTWSAPHAGWIFSRSLGLERLRMEGIAWRAFLQFHHVSSEGDDVFFRHQTGFPRHRLWVTASDERRGGFSWMMRAGYVSRWTWPEYVEPARRTVPADIILDATVGKSLFSGHLRALVSLLNLPDRALGHHPAGVEEQLAIRLTISFSSVVDRKRL